MNIYFDIETIPAQGDYRDSIVVSPPASLKLEKTIQQWEDGEGKYEGAKDAAVDEAYRKTSLNGTHGEILCIAWAFGDGPIKCAGRKLAGVTGGSTLSGFLGESESDVLSTFLHDVKTVLESASHTPYEKHATWIGHNISGFDLRFLWQRCVINNLKPPVTIPYKAKPWDDVIFDTYLEWAGSRGKGTLDEVSKAMGYEGKGDIDGSKVWGYVQAGRYEEIFAYCKDDVHKCRLIHKRMTFGG